MPNWNRLTWAICATVAVGVYFSTALWLKYSYVEPYKPAGVVLRLNRPFAELEGSNVAFAVDAPSLEELSDSSQAPSRSPIVLYENALPLGPAHSGHADIMKYGHGRFSHWNGSGLIFSSSDGTSPKTNGRTYWAVIPPSPAE
jgi:hypothetical protein